jgi:hypothetical protein
MKLFLLVLVCACIATRVAPAQNRAFWAEFALAGPLEGVSFEVGSAGTLHIDGALLAGEERRLVLPLPARSAAERVEPRVVIAERDPTLRGGARFVGWRDEPSALAKLPLGLRARASPALAAHGPIVPLSALALLAASAAIAVALRKRALLALGCALLAAVLLTLTVAAPSADGHARLCVIDGDVASAWWRISEAGYGRVELRGAPGEFELAVEPAGVGLTFRASLDGALEARAPGAKLVVTRALELEPSRSSRIQNGLASFAEVWVREAGAWTFRGSWSTGAALADARPGPDPPGWLASGLPQGIPIVLAREALGAGTRTYWRISGL